MIRVKLVTEMMIAGAKETVQPHDLEALDEVAVAATDLDAHLGQPSWARRPDRTQRRGRITLSAMKRAACWISPSIPVGSRLSVAEGPHARCALPGSRQRPAQRVKAAPPIAPARGDRPALP